MKTFLFFVCSLIFLNLLIPEIKKGGSIEVTVTNVEQGEGSIRAVLFKEADGFPGDAKKAYRQVSVRAEEGKVILNFPDIPYGTYAIAVLHDQNENGKLDTNTFGYPQEGYGVSNNQTSTFSAPKFEESRFELNEAEKRLLIHLRN